DQPLSHRWEACSKPAVQEGEPDHEPIARIDVLVDMEFEETELGDPERIEACKIECLPREKHLGETGCTHHELDRESIFARLELPAMRCSHHPRLMSISSQSRRLGARRSVL
ncbi:MAG: hypothetical protein AAF526_12175, partial [Pseudomonadota bacterium]